MNLADKFPEYHVTGTDLSAIQPIVPPNLHFEIDDCEQEWLYAKHLGIIHLRSLHGGIADWLKLLDRAYGNLIPGHEYS